MYTNTTQFATFQSVYLDAITKLKWSNTTPLMHTMSKLHIHDSATNINWKIHLEPFADIQTSQMCKFCAPSGSKLNCNLFEHWHDNIGSTNCKITCLPEQWKMGKSLKVVWKVIFLQFCLVSPVRWNLHTAPLKPLFFPLYTEKCNALNENNLT